MGGFGGGMNPTDSFRYSVLWFPKVPVGGQATDLQMIGENLSFTHPLWKDPLNALSLTGGVRNQLFDTNAILPEPASRCPRNSGASTLACATAGNWTTAGSRAAA